ncbi:hypothetical protein AcV5_008384 [Taiwanofungus camphoratus]|nr:hypothetical protein AcV5_008384 [Antrodia cinnamomea]
MTETHPPRNGLILSVNAGSSSLKISLYRRDGRGRSTRQPMGRRDDPVDLLLTSSISSMSAPPALFTFQLVSHEQGREVKKEPVDGVKDHTSAFEHFLRYLKQEASIDREEIVHVCHRVVHGGDYLEPVVISEESYHHIERLSDLAPLHNGSALSVMKACIQALPKANSIAYFDTSFHRSIPLHIASYAINQEIAQKRGLKKYGFHGLSYAYILSAVSHYLQKDPSSTNLIVMHLGSGASMVAIKGGKSLDTTMGLTPLNGLPGATRSGAIDPSLIFHYTNKAGRISHDRSTAVDVRVSQAEDILNTKSGWKALTGTTDFGEVVQRMKNAAGAQGGWGSEAKWRLVFDLFVDRIVGYVGSYFVKLGGDVDALVFSGGIGEKSMELREAVTEKATCLGFALDGGANEKAKDSGGVVVDIGKNKDARRVLVCRTDEQVCLLPYLESRQRTLIMMHCSLRWRRSARWRTNFGSDLLIRLCTLCLLENEFDTRLNFILFLLLRLESTGRPYKTSNFATYGDTSCEVGRSHGPTPRRCSQRVRSTHHRFLVRSAVPLQEEERGHYDIANLHGARCEQECGRR